MADLLRRPFGTHGEVHRITPESAGWRYVGFALHRLRAGERVAEATQAREVIVVMVEAARPFGPRGRTGASWATGWMFLKGRRRIAFMSRTIRTGRPRR